MLSSAGVFVPAYNAARHLEGVIARIPQAGWEMLRVVWIVNDGSTDSTQEAAERLSRSGRPVRVWRFERNQGYGAVVRKGLALCQDDGCDVTVCLHGDGQYPSEDVPRFVTAVREGGWDVLQGSRIASGTALAGGMPLYKYVAGRTLTAMENAVLGLRMSDYHSGFLAYSRKAMEAIPFDRLSGGFHFDLEVIVSARAQGLKVGELPIPTRYADEVSHLNPFAYGMAVLGVMGRYMAGRYRP